MSTVLAEIDRGDGRPVDAAAVGGVAVTVTPVDAVGLEARAAALAGRSIKRESKLAALDLAIRCMDLTTLEGTDTPGKVTAMCAKAVHPDPGDASIPSVAAVCVYPNLVKVAVERAAGQRRQGGQRGRRASRPGSPRSTVRLDEIRRAVADGADEIDMVLNRSAFLAGRYREAFDEIAASKEAVGPAHLKVILETGELGSYDAVRKASMLAMCAGADVIKTSTGKIGTSATLPGGPVHGRGHPRLRRPDRSGGRAQGGRRRSHGQAGVAVPRRSWARPSAPDWLDPDRFRIGASTLLNDVLMQIRWLREGRYQRPDDFTVD